MLKKSIVFVMFLSLALMFATGGQADDTKALSIATGGTGGTYYAIGGGMAKLVADYMPGYKLVVQSTGASIENVHLVANKKVDFAIIMPDAAYFAYNGAREFEGKAKYTNLRAAFAGHASLLQAVVLQSSGVKSVAGLKGKKVALGAPGSPSKFAAMALLQAYGLMPGDYKDVYLTYAEMVQALKDGTIDCAMVFAGVPTAALLDLTTTEKAVFLPIEEDKLGYVKRNFPYYGTGKIKANTYSGQTEEIPVITSPAVLLTRDDVPDEVVYQFTATVLDHTKELGEIHKAGNEWNIDGATEGIAIPYHPGAEKYLKEKGKLK